ncbi:unnamed protein product, partial [Amoebophrya sp. A120]|eukprot:GSA120T00016704001.1
MKIEHLFRSAFAGAQEDLFLLDTYGTKRPGRTTSFRFFAGPCKSKMAALVQLCFCLSSARPRQFKFILFLTGSLFPTSTWGVGFLERVEIAAASSDVPVETAPAVKNDIERSPRRELQTEEMQQQREEFRPHIGTDATHRDRVPLAAILGPAGEESSSSSLTGKPDEREDESVDLRDQLGEDRDGTNKQEEANEHFYRDKAKEALEESYADVADLAHTAEVAEQVELEQEAAIQGTNAWLVDKVLKKSLKKSFPSFARNKKTTPTAQNGKSPGRGRDEFPEKEEEDPQTLDPSRPRNASSTAQEEHEQRDQKTAHRTTPRTEESESAQDAEEQLWDQVGKSEIGPPGDEDGSEFSNEEDAKRARMLNEMRLRDETLSGRGLKLRLVVNSDGEAEVEDEGYPPGAEQAAPPRLDGRVENDRATLEDERDSEDTGELSAFGTRLYSADVDAVHPEEEKERARDAQVEHELYATESINLIGSVKPRMLQPEQVPTMQFVTWRLTTGSIDYETEKCSILELAQKAADIREKYQKNPVEWSAEEVLKVLRGAHATRFGVCADEYGQPVEQFSESEEGSSRSGRSASSSSSSDDADNSTAKLGVGSSANCTNEKQVSICDARMVGQTWTQDVLLAMEDPDDDEEDGQSEETGSDDADDPALLLQDEKMGTPTDDDGHQSSLETLTSTPPSRKYSRKIRRRSSRKRRTKTKRTHRAHRSNKKTIKREGSNKKKARTKNKQARPHSFKTKNKKPVSLNKNIAQSERMASVHFSSEIERNERNAVGVGVHENSEDAALDELQDEGGDDLEDSSSRPDVQVVPSTSNDFWVQYGKLAYSGIELRGCRIMAKHIVSEYYPEETRVERTYWCYTKDENVEILVRIWQMTETGGIPVIDPHQTEKFYRRYLAFDSLTQVPPRPVAHSLYKKILHLMHLTGKHNLRRKTSQDFASNIFGENPLNMQLRNRKNKGSFDSSLSANSSTVVTGSGSGSFLSTSSTSTGKNSTSFQIEREEEDDRDADDFQERDLLAADRSSTSPEPVGSSPLKNSYSEHDGVMATQANFGSGLAGPDDGYSINAGGTSTTEKMFSNNYNKIKKSHDKPTSSEGKTSTSRSSTTRTTATGRTASDEDRLHHIAEPSSASLVPSNAVLDDPDKFIFEKLESESIVEAVLHDPKIDAAEISRAVDLLKAKEKQDPAEDQHEALHLRELQARGPNHPSAAGILVTDPAPSASTSNSVTGSTSGGPRIWDDEHEGRTTTSGRNDHHETEQEGPGPGEQPRTTLAGKARAMVLRGAAGAQRMMNKMKQGARELKKVTKRGSKRIFLKALFLARRAYKAEPITKAATKLKHMTSPASAPIRRLGQKVEDFVVGTSGKEENVDVELRANPEKFVPRAEIVAELCRAEVRTLVSQWIRLPVVLLAPTLVYWFGSGAARVLRMLSPGAFHWLTDQDGWSQYFTQWAIFQWMITTSGPATVNQLFIDVSTRLVTWVHSGAYAAIRAALHNSVPEVADANMNQDKRKTQEAAQDESQDKPGMPQSLASDNMNLPGGAAGKVDGTERRLKRPAALEKQVPSPEMDLVATPETTEIKDVPNHGGSVLLASEKRNRKQEEDDPGHHRSPLVFLNSAALQRIVDNHDKNREYLEEQANIFAPVLSEIMPDQVLTGRDGGAGHDEDDQVDQHNGERNEESTGASSLPKKESVVASSSSSSADHLSTSSAISSSTRSGARTNSSSALSSTSSTATGNNSTGSSVGDHVPVGGENNYSEKQGGGEDEDDDLVLASFLEMAREHEGLLHALAFEHRYYRNGIERYGTARTTTTRSRGASSSASSPSGGVSESSAFDEISLSESVRRTRQRTTAGSLFNTTHQGGDMATSSHQLVDEEQGNDESAAASLFLEEAAASAASFLLTKAEEATPTRRNAAGTEVVAQDATTTPPRSRIGALRQKMATLKNKASDVMASVGKKIRQGKPAWLENLQGYISYLRKRMRIIYDATLKGCLQVSSRKLPAAYWSCWSAIHMLMHDLRAVPGECFFLPMMPTPCTHVYCCHVVLSC